MQQSAFHFQKPPVSGAVASLTSCSPTPLDLASSSLALMRQATVTVTSELSACNICRVCVRANVICAHSLSRFRLTFRNSQGAGNCCSLLELIPPCDVNACCGPVILQLIACVSHFKLSSTLTDYRVIRLIVANSETNLP